MKKIIFIIAGILITTVSFSNTYQDFYFFNNTRYIMIEGATQSHGNYSPLIPPSMNSRICQQFLWLQGYQAYPGGSGYNVILKCMDEKTKELSKDTISFTADVTSGNLESAQGQCTLNNKIYRIKLSGTGYGQTIMLLDNYS